MHNTWLQTLSSKILLTLIALRDYEIFNSLLMINDEFKDWLKLCNTTWFVNEIWQQWIEIKHFWMLKETILDISEQEKLFILNNNMNFF